MTTGHRYSIFRVVDNDLLAFAHGSTPQIRFKRRLYYLYASVIASLHTIVSSPNKYSNTLLVLTTNNMANKQNAPVNAFARARNLIDEH